MLFLIYDVLFWRERRLSLSEFQRFPLAKWWLETEKRGMIGRKSGVPEVICPAPQHGIWV
jgi:hypothetical protein